MQQRKPYTDAICCTDGGPTVAPILGIAFENGDGRGCGEAPGGRDELGVRRSCSPVSSMNLTAFQHAGKDEGRSKARGRVNTAQQVST